MNFALNRMKYCVWPSVLVFLLMTCWFRVQAITRRQILDSSKLKEVADDNFKFDKNGRKLSKHVENTVGKGEIARYKQFLLFPMCFQKACFPEVSKGVIVWEWVNTPWSMLCRLFSPFTSDASERSTHRKLCWHWCEIARKSGGALTDCRDMTPAVKMAFQNPNKQKSEYMLYRAHSHTMTPFDAPRQQAFWKHCGKGEIARNKQFLLFPKCFRLVWIIFCHFHQIWNCCLQSLSFRKSLKFVIS